MQKELCRGTYRAEQAHGQVTVFATGQHPTGGYKVSFEPIKMPNAYKLYHERPEGIVNQMVTPFDVNTTYTAHKKVATVSVTDADGGHKVPVEQVLDKKTPSARVMHAKTGHRA